MPRLPARVLSLVGVLCAAALVVAATAQADLTLTDIHAGLTGVRNSSAAWGDYDNDGQLDLVITGDSTFSIGPVTRLYHNNGGVFSPVPTSIPNVEGGGLAWGDCDADGDLDLFLDGSGSFLVSATFRNDAGAFHRTGAFEPADARAAFLDYDNDGDLDLVWTGLDDDNIVPFAYLYRNDGNYSFTSVGGLETPPLYHFFRAVSCGDFDNDGRTDLLLDGLLLHNAGAGTWTPAHPELPQPAFTNVGPWSHATSAVGDFDNDGDPDIFLMDSGYSRIYRNDGPAGFTDIHAQLDTLISGTAKWVDFDNDGNLDLFITGHPAFSDQSTPRAELYRNDGAGHFVPVPMPSLAPGGGGADWGDYDNDGRLDLLLTGVGYNNSGRIAAIYRADGIPTNAPPSAPTGLTWQIVGNQLNMSWDAATDDHTPPLGLSYNVRVGTLPGRDDIVPCMADPVTGKRRLTAWGNAGERRWMKIQLPATWDVLYWSVQAIDGQYAGSLFAPEQIVGGVPTLPTSASAQADADGVHLVWICAETTGAASTVYRREAAHDWVALGSAKSGDSPQYLTFTDTSVHPGNRYAYRLGIRDGSSEMFTEEIGVEVPSGALSFALDPMTPNPSIAGKLSATFSLASASPASLSLVDAKGRILMQQSFSGAGRYTARLTPSQRLQGGRYFLRLDQGGQRLVRALTILGQ